MNLTTLIWSAAGGLFTLVTLFGGYAFSSVQANVSELQKDVPVVRERMATVEAKVSNQEEQLDRIEQKLDVVIEHEIDEHQRRDRLPHP